MMRQSHVDCLIYLEKVRWDGVPTCPYCNSKKSSAYKKEQRYHCNNCFTSYSVTVGTLFHRTHVDLRKWFDAITLLRCLDGDISVRRLAQEIGVSRAAAASIVDRIHFANECDVKMLKEIEYDHNCEK